MNVDPKLVFAGLAAIGVGAGAMAGYVKIMTPSEAQCQVDLADAKARLELLVEAKDQCKTALAACAGKPGEGP